MSDNKGGDNTNETKPLRLEATISKTADDALMSGTEGVENQNRYKEQKTLENSKGPSDFSLPAIPGNNFEITGQKDGKSGQAMTDKVPQGTKTFQLESQAEEIKWKEWQERLNQEINRKLQQLMVGSSVPNNTETHASYKVYADGGWDIKVNPGPNQEHINIVAKAIDDTLRYHPELKKFPEGTHKQFYERKDVKFTVGGGGGYSTGDTETEIHKK